MTEFSVVGAKKDRNVSIDDVRLDQRALRATRRETEEDTQHRLILKHYRITKSLNDALDAHLLVMRRTHPSMSQSQQVRTLLRAAIDGLDGPPQQLRSNLAAWEKMGVLLDVIAGQLVGREHEIGLDESFTDAMHDILQVTRQQTGIARHLVARNS